MTRKELVSRAFFIWETHGETYRTLRYKYRYLLRLKRELGLKPLKQVMSAVIEDYPTIPMLDCLAESDLLEYLLDIPDESLEIRLNYIEYVLWYDYSYNTLLNKVKEYLYQIEHADWTPKQGRFCPDPPTGASRNARKKHIAVRNLGGSGK